MTTVQILTLIALWCGSSTDWGGTPIAYRGHLDIQECRDRLFACTDKAKFGKPFALDKCFRDELFH